MIVSSFPIPLSGFILFGLIFANKLCAPTYISSGSADEAEKPYIAVKLKKISIGFLFMFTL